MWRLDRAVVISVGLKKPARNRTNERIVAPFADILFYIFAFLTLTFGFLVVLNPFSTNPVTSAMFLVLTIASLAGLFVLLHAFFLAAVQILVYAGAVMVLFLFVIMLLDLPAEERRKVRTTGLVLGLISVGTILVIILRSLLQSPLNSDPAPIAGREHDPAGQDAVHAVPAAIRDYFRAAARGDGWSDSAEQKGSEVNIGV